VTLGGTALLYKMAYDDGGISAPTGCGADLSTSASLTLGRVRYRLDSFGYTWLRYDQAGRVIDEIRARDGTCGSDPHNNPSTHYAYNANGRSDLDRLPVRSNGFLCVWNRRARWTRCEHRGDILRR